MTLMIEMKFVHSLITRLAPMCLALAVLTCVPCDGVASNQTAPIDSNTPSSDQTYLVDQWRVPEGLPTNVINGLAFDEIGYLWLATSDGLVRFDGHAFKVFHRGNTEGLQTTRLRKVYAQKGHGLWVLDEFWGLYHFDGQQHFERISLAGHERITRAIEETIHGDLVLGTTKGLFWQTKDGFKQVKSTEDHYLASPYVSADGCVWGASLNKAVFKVCDGAVIEQTPLVPMSNAAGTIWKMHTDEQGIMHLVPNDGLYRQTQGGWERYPETADHEFIDLAFLKTKQWLLRSKSDIFLFDPKSLVLTRMAPSTSRKTLPLRSVDDKGNEWLNYNQSIVRDGTKLFQSKCSINSVVFDQADGVWLGTGCEGLVRLRPRTITMLDDQHAPQPTYGIAQAHDGDVYATSIGQLSRWSVSGAQQLFPISKTYEEKLRGGIDPDIIRVLYTDSNGEVLVGQYGVCRLKGELCLELPSDNPELMHQKRTLALHRDKRGDLWAGGVDGLWRLRDRVWTQMTDPQTHQSKDSIRVIYESEEGGLWFGTVGNGIWRRTVDGEKQSFGLASGLSSLSVRDIIKDESKRLWVVTENRGVCVSQVLLDVADVPSFRCLTTQQGLHSDSLHRVIPDDDGRYWFNSNTGIFSLRRDDLIAAADNPAKHLHPRVYGKQEGLLNPEGNGGINRAGIRLQDGRLAFPTQDGVALIDTSQVALHQTPPRVVFQNVRLMDGALQAPQSNQVMLPLGERSFTLNFTALTDGLTDRVYFRYRLAPNQDEWVEVGSDRSLSFSRLPPGKHELQVEAYQPSSGQTSPVSVLTLVLPLHVWERFYVQLAALLVLLGMLSWWVWQRMQAGRRREMELASRVQQRTRDLSEQTQKTQKALEEVEQQRARIEQLSEAKSAFFANASHELRTPLTIMLGPLQKALAGEEIPPNRLEAMVRSGHRLKRLIDHLLDLERLDAQRFPLQRKNIVLSDVIEDALALFTPYAAQHQIDLSHSKHAANDRLLVHADPDQMMRVLGNLLSNAIKFTPEGGQIVVSTKQENQYAILSVDDSGHGIPEGWRERVFDRFEQIANPDTRVREGAGLGLAMCREIARLHEGDLFAMESELGGARLVLRLPLNHEQANDHNQAKTETHQETLDTFLSPVSDSLESATVSSALPLTSKANAQSLKNTQRVLVVEDNDDLRSYVHDILKPYYHVRVAADGVEALAMAESWMPDLVVSDVMMPNMDGFELVRALRRHPQLGGVPLIFLTARAAVSDEIQGLSLGADQYIRKPFDNSLLLAKVAAAIKMVQRLRQPPQATSQPNETSVPEGVTAPTGSHVVSAANQHAQEMMTRALAWLEAHLHLPECSAEELADHLHVSRRTLDRLFREHHTETVTNCLKRKRLERAQEMLHKQKGSVSEVAYACGFSALSGFSRAYKKHFGHAPTHALDAPSP